MSDRLNILALNYEYPPLGGGGGVLAEHVLERLAELGHGATIITSAFDELPATESRNGVEIHRLPVLGRGRRNTASMFSMLSYDPMARRAGVKLSRQQKFDVMLTFFAIPTGPAGDYVHRKSGIPNVLFLLGGDVYDPSKSLSPHKTPILRNAVERVINRADHVFAGSKDTCNSALEHYDVTRDIEVVPLSIEPFDIPANVDRKKLGLVDDDIVIVTVGRVVSRKNVDALIDSVTRLKGPDGHNERVKLIVIGDGPERSRLMDLVNDQQRQSQIQLVGNIDNESKHEYLACADIYASTSIHEGFGLVFLEGMHAGLPIVCYDNGGQTDFVIDGENGFVAKLNDIDRFTQALDELIADPALRERMRMRNLEDVKRYYVSTTCERYLEVLQELSRNKP